VWAGTLRDDFDDGNMDEWDLSRAFDSWKVENGELVITPRGVPVEFFIGETTWDDYTVRVKTKIVKSTGVMEGFGIMVRKPPLPLHYYGFLLGTAKGERFLFYVDDQLVIDYTDDVHSKGKVGIGAGVSGTTAHFDDFSVTSDGIQSSSVSPKAKLVATWSQVKGF